MRPHAFVHLLSIPLLGAASGALVGCGDKGDDEESTMVDGDGDGVSEDEDCDDADPDSFPGAEERCDGADNDCDGDVDEGVLIDIYDDEDGDGFGAGDVARQACEPGDGEADNADDCDDASDRVHPDASERCDEVDNDCDGLVDDEDDDVDAGSQSNWFPDADGDGYGGTGGSPVQACEQPDGYGTGANDCDEAAPTIKPAAPELCNGIDDDCDGDIDGAADGWLLSSEFDTAASLAALQINGDAGWDDYSFGGALFLTGTSPGRVGSAFTHATMGGSRWEASFRLRTGSSGLGFAEGTTFAWLAPSESATSLGGGGEDMGFYGLDGYAVEFDEVANGGDDSARYHVALARGDGTTYAVNTSTPFGAAADNEVVIRFDEGDVEVEIDGSSVLSATIPDYDQPLTRFGLTAASGESAADHAIEWLTISCPASE
jgi:hypothetical protein